MKTAVVLLVLASGLTVSAGIADAQQRVQSRTAVGSSANDTRSPARDARSTASYGKCDISAKVAAEGVLPGEAGGHCYRYQRRKAWEARGYYGAW
jgi:hypothetical protein